MPRPLRPIDDGLIYHVINRGNNRQDVFRKPEDFQAFLAALLDLKARRPFALYGYCLMSNHFHLLIRPTGATISRIMQSSCRTRSATTSTIVQAGMCGRAGSRAP
jgi:REP-associated tyrosine transposase